MNLWVDDTRSAPDGWDWAKTSKEAFDLLADTRYVVVSLDHDLGFLPLDEMIAKCDAIKAAGGKVTEYDTIDTTRPIVLYWCEHGDWPDEVRVHSSNPVGVEWLEGMIKRYKP